MSNIVPLGEVVKIRYGYSFPASDFSDKGIPAIRMSDLQDYVVDTTNAARVPEHYWDKLEGYRIFKGDLIIGMSGSVGKLGIFNDDKPALQNQRVGVFVIKSPNKIDKDYLKYFAFTLEEKLLEISKGVAVKNVSAEEIESLRLPIPPLTEQKRIASLLRRADRLRHLRRTAHDLGDSVLQSVFLEMFGDPVSNPKNWDVKEIQEVVINHDSKRIPLEESVRAKRQGRYPYYGATGIIDYLDDYIFDEDMLLIAEDGKNLLNRTKPLAFMAYGKYWVNNHSHVVSSAGQINLRYLEAALNIRDISAYVTGIDQFKLNRANLDVIPIHVPPLNLQEEFAGVVARVESLRGRMSEGERQVEGLFESLLAEVFNG